MKYHHKRNTTADSPAQLSPVHHPRSLVVTEKRGENCGSGITATASPLESQGRARNWVREAAPVLECYRSHFYQSLRGNLKMQSHFPASLGKDKLIKCTSKLTENKVILPLQATETSKPFCQSVTLVVPHCTARG